MSRWTASRLAWSLWLLAMALVVLSVLLGVRNAATVAAFVDDTLVFVPMVVSFATVGALVAARHPRNPIGWLFASFAAIVGLVLVAQGYATYALVTAPGSVPGGDWAAWLGAWSLAFTIGIPAFIFLLFPDGHLLSPRWRPLAWLIVATGTLGVALAALSNLGVADASPFASSPIQVLRGGTVRAVYNANQAVEAAVLLACALCLVVRLRRAKGAQRQQLKWVAYTATVGFAAFGIVALVGWPEPVVVAIVAFPAVAIAAAIAILRYRLYDIDLLITRTLVYGLLTALVTTVYLAVVVGIGTLIGSRGKSNLFLSIVATAMIAVAFQPARERSRRLANRLVYGKRATPYEVLSEFSRGMAGASTDDSLLRMARLVVEATGAVKATVWLRLGEVLQPHAAWPQTGPLPEPIALEGRGVQEALVVLEARGRAFPVAYEEELLGALTVTVSPSEPLTVGGEKLIADLAARTGLGLRFERLKGALCSPGRSPPSCHQRSPSWSRPHRRRCRCGRSWRPPSCSPTSALLPPDLRDWLLDDHLAWSCSTWSTRSTSGPSTGPTVTTGTVTRPTTPSSCLACCCTPTPSGCAPRGRSSGAASRTSPSGCWPATRPPTTSPSRASASATSKPWLASWWPR